MFSFAASYITTGRWSVSSPASGIVLVSFMVFLLDIVVRMKSNLRCCTEIFAFVPGVDFAGSRKKKCFWWTGHALRRGSVCVVHCSYTLCWCRCKGPSVDSMAVFSCPPCREGRPWRQLSRHLTPSWCCLRVAKKKLIFSLVRVGESLQGAYAWK